MSRLASGDGRIVFGILASALLALSGCVTVNLYPQEKGLVEKVIKPSMAQKRFFFSRSGDFWATSTKKGESLFLEEKLTRSIFSKKSFRRPLRTVV